ncbi:cobalt-precorrin-5B (C(1))-methyltransferase [Thalassospira xiamenensis]|jgi:cobalt-precorrin-5B (C1)-methyltransferase|uniref:Cobalt-precorrin-5B C(1)-methyltransferase n=1 Tax=Thalassospira xiamenensis TaxID=220697 RepID=A0A367XAP4_9PROT|nr:cobalt-precorrin-5B (C(1))-methyltransferase [Thalassospira xiamenensis]KZB52922.1 cobalt-precorrin-6A synthase [Thalassospira xiamenensis]MCK2168593.1 cobalt-precorrin-5B (C(1))-methyltransferase [Thalassospira xiamenensis]RCK50529.1 cobalt-precorrin-6A synthase [Thalassospira xiamenensis]
MTRKPDGPLRKGWTTGACATAATRAAWQALLSGEFPDPVTITLPRGETPSFSLIKAETGEGWARASVIKDAGDDPDVTHGAEIIATIRHGQQGSGITFRAGDGVGMITKPGLPIPVGEAAINPKPREMMTQQIVELANRFNATADVEIEISIPGGQEIALKTWNPRLGIVGGLSVLGTTGIVIPFSCSAWIHSIHRGIDVARATGRRHVAGATGKTSEAAIRQFYSLPDEAILDMGDFVGGMLKYLRRHPVEFVTISGGFAKLVKLAQGHMDLHSSRSEVDFEKLAETVAALGGDTGLVSEVASANTAKQVLELCTSRNVDIARTIALQAAEAARATIDGASAIEIVVVDRAGRIVARAGHGDFDAFLPAKATNPNL